MKLNSLLTAGILLAATTPTFAADDLGFYLGGQVNNTAVEDNIGTLDESAKGLGAYGGYNFNDSFGIEVSIFATDSFVDDVDFRMAAITISPVLRHAITDSVTAYLKAGLVVNKTYSNDDDIDESYETSETEPEHSELDNYYADISLVQYGIGLHYRF